MLAAFIVFGRSVQYDFVNWDDDLYVTRNASIRELNVRNLEDWFVHPYVSLYVPLPMLSYALNYKAAGLDPSAYHVTNVILHAANGVLVFLLYLAFFRDAPLSFLGALAFVCHPAQVETVAWISQRKSLLCAFFLILGVLFYNQGAAAERDRKRTALACVFFVLALLSKATAVIVPLLLLAYDYFYRGTVGKRKGLLLSLFLLVPATAMVFFTLALYPEVLAKFHGTHVVDYVLGQGKTLLFYAKHAVLPWPQDLVYEGLTEIGPGVKERLGLALLGTVVTGLLFAASWRKERYGFWLAWTLLFLLPVVNVFRVPVSDRHLYLPLVGFIGTLLWLFSRWKKTGILFLTAWTAGLILLSWHRLPVWQNSETLWNSVTSRRGMMFVARMQLAGYYEDRGDLEKASRGYWDIIAIQPQLPYPYLNLYNLYTQHGQKANAATVAEFYAQNYSQHFPLPELYEKLVRSKNEPGRVRELVHQVIEDHDDGKMQEDYWEEFQSQRPL
ncbi:MAG TPA: hypothetical protein VL688_12735 [Verrucomicrobiae bacterium]|nr:hypothetical protein [Verrucomicrobiae bacterium]